MSRFKQDSLHMPKGVGTVNSCVKCALSSLGCSPALRGAIDDLAVRVHIIAVRGTHLANHIISQLVRGTNKDEPLPDLSNFLEPKWWQHCFKATANPLSGKEGILHETAARLFAGSKCIPLGSAAKHAIETLSQDVVVNIRVMLILNFHKQLRKAFRRDILFYAALRGFEFEASDREELIDYCIWRCVQQGSLFHEVEFPLHNCEPPELGIELQEELDSKIDSWRSVYGHLLHCPVPQFISQFKDPEMIQLFRWFVDLQRQRRDRQAELTNHFSGNSEMAMKCFSKAGKAMRALPLTQLRVGHIAVDRTTLKFLLLELRKAGAPISDLEIPLFKPVEAKKDEMDRDENGEPQKKKVKRNVDGTEKKTRNRRKGDDDAEQTALFWSHFPRAQRLVHGRKGVKLHPFIRTDGISCSVSLILPGRPEGKDEIKALKQMENRCDLDPGNQKPLIPEAGQRLVAIDPGRRDMVYCFVKADHPNRFFRVSTRQHVREAKRQRIAAVTLNLQKGTILSADVYRDQDRHADLHSALRHLPSNKAFETYEEYEIKMLPILEEAVAAMSARRLRREKFLSYQSKDKALDLICSKICEGVAIPKIDKLERPRVLVAFGNGGKVSTTGCGYAPAPQARLRHRLQRVWGAHVSLINEFRTSKCCCQCGEVMSKIYKRRNKGMVLNKAKVIHGVLRCQDHGFVHRDKNAAINIMRIYESLARGEERPEALRLRGRRFT